jgi:hypothetical protein
MNGRDQFLMLMIQKFNIYQNLFLGLKSGHYYVMKRSALV